MTLSRKIFLASSATAVAAVFLWAHFGLLGDLDPAQRARVWERFIIHFFCAASVAQLLRGGMHGMELRRSASLGLDDQPLLVGCLHPLL